MIPYSTQLIDQHDIDAVVNALQGSHLTQGNEVNAFEDDIAAYLGVKHVIIFNSATSALFAAYSALGITQGDEIITTPISFVATSNMAVALGATPVFCDVKLNGNIDERLIEPLITPRTKAIVPVDFGGNPVAIDTINALAKKYNLFVIEDACHAFGSEVNTQKVGTFADMSIFSFHAIKPITTGEGGAVTTNNDAFAKTLRLIRSHGIEKGHLWSADMVQMGHNFRMTDFAAALGRSQLKKIESFIAQRNMIAAYYDERFAANRLFSTVTISPNTRSARHLYPIVFTPAMQCVKEDIFMELHKQGIGVQVHYKPIYQNSFYKEHFGVQRLHVAEDFYRGELSLPCQQKMSLEDATFVADTFLTIVDRYQHRGCSF